METMVDPVRKDLLGTELIVFNTGEYLTLSGHKKRVSRENNASIQQEQALYWRRVEVTL